MPLSCCLQLRVAKVTGGAASKLAKIKVYRKDIARVLTVYNQKQKESVRARRHVCTACSMAARHDANLRSLAVGRSLPVPQGLRHQQVRAG